MRVCLITGAGSGIGEATALLMAREGHRVAVLGRTPDETRETAAAIRAEGGEALCVTADVSIPDLMQTAVEEVVAHYGRLDILFANAGINGVWAAIDDLTPEEWDRTMEVNVRGTFLTLRYTVPHLKRQGGSIIINASVNGTRVFSNSGATAYAASKAAQVAIAKMAALELAEHEIRVNVICPGAIESEIDDNTEERGTENLGVPVDFPRTRHPLRGKPGSAEQVARLVAFLASDAADHITGTEMWIDGGESLLGPRS